MRHFKPAYAQAPKDGEPPPIISLECYDDGLAFDPEHHCHVDSNGVTNCPPPAPLQVPGYGVYTNQPMGIRVIILGADVERGHGGADWTTVAFKVQCQKCHALFGAWDKTEGDQQPAVLPSDAAVRAAAMDYLPKLGFVFDGHHTCSACATDGKDLRSTALLVKEEEPPPPTTGWYAWEGAAA